MNIELTQDYRVRVEPMKRAAIVALGSICFIVVILGPALLRVA